MMADVGIPDDVAIDLEKQIKTLKELCEKNAESFWGEPEENSTERFKDVSIKISSILPDVSDRKSFEIDDLLYPEDDKTIVNIPKTALYSEETNTLISQRCFHSYQFVYRRMVLSKNHRSKSALYDMTYLQLLEHVPQEFLTVDRGCCKVLGVIAALIDSRSEFKLCIALKIMKVALKNFKEILVKYLYNDICSFVRLINLPKIPQAKDPNKRRVTTWLSEQSTLIIETIDFKSLENVDRFLVEFLDTYGDEVHTSIDYLRMLRMAYTGKALPNYINKLYTYFMSAKNEEEKLERLRTYLQSLYKNYKGIRSTAHFSLKLCFAIDLETFKTCEDYTDEQLRDMEKHCNYVMEPYLSDDTFNSLVWRPNVRQLINDKLSDGKASDNEKETSEDHDYTVERFILFDDLMKYTHVMNILYTAVYKCEDLFKTTGCVGDATTFRCEFCPVNEYIKEIIINPSKRGYIPWWIETILRKCPFVFLSNCHDYLMEDLIKLLKGEHVDEITQEELFHAVNTVYVKDDDHYYFP